MEALWLETQALMLSRSESRWFVLNMHVFTDS